MKQSTICFIQHYKVLKIKEERALKYTDGLIGEYAQKKFDQLSYCYPDMKEETKIR